MSENVLEPEDIQFSIRENPAAPYGRLIVRMIWIPPNAHTCPPWVWIMKAERLSGSKILPIAVIVDVNKQ